MLRIKKFGGWCMTGLNLKIGVYIAFSKSYKYINELRKNNGP